MLKRLTIFILSALLITACGGGGGNPLDPEVLAAQGKELYENETFLVVIPQDWEAITPQNFDPSIPNSIMAAFRNNIQSEIFTANVNIGTVPLAEEISSEDFAIRSLNQNKDTLIDFAELDRAEHFFGEQSTLRITFQGRRSPTDPPLNFEQIYFVIGDLAYVITSAHSSSEDESVVNMMDEMLDSFTLK